MKQLRLFFKPFLSLLLLYLFICTSLRIILLLSPIVHGHFSVGGLLKIFAFGLISNIFMFFQVGALFWLYLLFLSNGKYKRPYGWIIFGFLIALWLYVICFNTILNEYGSVLPLVAAIFIAVKLVLFGLMLFLPNYRNKIRNVAYFCCVFLFVACLLLNAVSEWGFFNEFGVRYNFIAVDYLIYTNEVIGNIMESYPVVPLFSTIGLVSLFLTWVIVRKTNGYLLVLPSFRQKLQIAGLNIAVILLGWLCLPLLRGLENSQNVFANELQADGIYKFYQAYTYNQLSYDEFYPTMEDKRAFRLLSGQLPGIHGESTLRTVGGSDTAAEMHKNVVLITVESLSADYMGHFGNKDHLTPFLDSLADRSLFFTNLYATGNRTVRGLEAVTLGLPPTPGESVIKREDNKQKFGIGYLFGDRHYNVRFMYGGYSYFDNMKDFYIGNGYRVTDRDNFKADEISFANVWGVCDEDMAKKAIQIMNEDAQNGQPFFDHWMTVSNHRPFTYPNGKIDIPGNAKSRKGGVRYTDYALQRFFEMAEQQPWFDSTVFVIVADHCASSAGKTALPMDKYRIPAIVYSRGFVHPMQVAKMASQIDLMPTVLGLLHFKYNTKFYGRDVLKPDYIPRAFMATYQDMGYVKDSTLTVISPVKQVIQYHLRLVPEPGIAKQFQERYREVPTKQPDQHLIDETIAYYQSASWLLSHHGFQR